MAELLNQLKRLEQLRGSRALLFACQDEDPFPKSFEDADVSVLYDCLQALGKVERLDVVLHSVGGKVTLSRKIYTLLRSYAKQLTIFVPHKARSAATLLCLGADEIVMTPLAELGPLDPHISAAQSVQGTPSIVSCEDIHAYRNLAEDWFGLTSEAQRIEVFKLLSERFFPTTLGSFYRAYQQMDSFATEFLTRQLPDASPSKRADIVRQLISGYFEHDYAIDYCEARSLGLAVRPASSEEELILNALRRGYREAFSAQPVQDDSTSAHKTLTALLLSTDTAARYVMRLEPVNASEGEGIHHLKGGWQVTRSA